jgi:hypothetical protein
MIKRLDFYKVSSLGLYNVGEGNAKGISVLTHSFWLPSLPSVLEHSFLQLLIVESNKKAPPLTK